MNQSRKSPTNTSSYESPQKTVRPADPRLEFVAQAMKDSAIVDHPFKENLSIVRFKLDVGLPETPPREGWSDFGQGMFVAPDGTIRREYDTCRTTVEAQ